MTGFIRSFAKVMVSVLILGFSGLGAQSMTLAAPNIFDGVYGFDLIQSGKTVGAVYAFPGCNPQLKEYVWVYFKSFRARQNGRQASVTLQPMRSSRALPSSPEALINSLNPDTLNRVERARAGLVPTEDVGGDSGGIIDMGDCPE